MRHFWGNFGEELNKVKAKAIGQHVYVTKQRQLVLFVCRSSFISLLYQRNGHLWPELWMLVSNLRVPTLWFS